MCATNIKYLKISQLKYLVRDCHWFSGVANVGQWQLSLANAQLRCKCSDMDREILREEKRRWYKHRSEFIASCGDQTAACKGGKGFTSDLLVWKPDWNLEHFTRNASKFQPRVIKG